MYDRVPRRPTLCRCSRNLRGTRLAHGGGHGLAPAPNVPARSAMLTGGGPTGEPQGHAGMTKRRRVAPPPRVLPCGVPAGPAVTVRPDRRESSAVRPNRDRDRVGIAKAGDHLQRRRELLGAVVGNWGHDYSGLHGHVGAEPNPIITGAADSLTTILPTHRDFVARRMRPLCDRAPRLSRPDSRRVPHQEGGE